MENRIKEVRTSSTFANYVAHTEEQQHAYSMMTTVASQVIQLQETILAETNPFPRCNFIFMDGAPGVGKTHLQESFVNEVKEKAPELLEKICLFRGNFTHAFMSFAWEKEFDQYPIMLIDDLFVQTANPTELHPNTDGAAMFNFMMQAYNKKNLVIFSSNFSIDKDLKRIALANDPLGRLSSRLQEVAAGTIHVNGPDGRSAKKSGLFLK